MSNITQLRQNYHQQLCADIIRVKRSRTVEYPNFADSSSKASIEISLGILDRLGCEVLDGKIKGQTTGGLFEKITKDFLQESFAVLDHLRPGRWGYFLNANISDFDQYEHLAYLSQLASEDKDLSSVLGVGYIVKPDIVVGRAPISLAEVNQYQNILSSDNVAKLTPLLEENHREIHLLLHASISCKWTLRSDRSQNARTEALNLVRNRKGNLPHIVAVTAEPLPTRIAALALGTGDLDCVYHFALPELLEAVRDVSEDQLEMLQDMVAGRRLRDISDLPFDLAI